MRTYIDTIETAIEQHPLDENEIIDADFNWRDNLNRGNVIGDIDGEPVIELDLGEDDLIALSVGDPSKAYLIYSPTGTFQKVWEMMVNPTMPRQGWASKLLVFFAKRHRVLIDPQLSKASAAMIEKLVASGQVKAHIADLSSSTMVEYNPARDAGLGMYDELIPGISRPTIPNEEAKNKTWVLESAGQLRPALLQRTRRRL